MMFTTGVVLAILAFANAAPSPATPQPDLDISISSILSGDLSEVSSHDLFPKYQAWIVANPDFDFANGNASVIEKVKASTLTGIQCTAIDDHCFLKSSVQLAPTLETSSNPASLFKRANANDMSLDTHWKTYYSSQEGGHEHYTKWNLHCNRLDYRSTGFVLSGETIAYFSANDISTKAFIYEYRYQPHTLTLQSNYACAWYRNSCCDSYQELQNTGSGTVSRWTYECAAGSSAAGTACQG
ncbi:hypothetical protein BKA64DRAFT_159867 [Cadophora sp. MPI-SDFR-AT-0126]|nr:hypothetical protein BKA64DRAFT_159867 [Leotiomycetes sp. MPI-SDFR-AT-0126]